MIATTRNAPWHGIDASAMRFLEVHETLAHAMSGRIFRDLGDCVLLHSAHDAEPFYNRVGAIRWPADKGAFDNRLAEIVTIFGSVARRPNVWAGAGFNTPPDLGPRLRAHGFVAQEGGYVMVLVRAPSAGSPVTAADVTVERLDGGRHVPAGRIDEIAWVLVTSFGLDSERAASIADETALALESPSFHVGLVRERGEPVAVGKRYTFDGASYLSSIGTRPDRWGRGHGVLVTDALVRDAVDAGSRFVHLGVHTRNARAIDVYRRVGFEPIGQPAVDYLLI